ncbi:MAG: hypothetical protein V7K48_09820 [Nostoc sp.]|uniref:hypothetical protein n=1 Tax=Nostoc sp. TaxID=1180 RepID=UPI002FFCC7FD
MQRVFKKSFIVSVTTAIALLFVGCGESKVAQCNKVINVANQASTLGQEFGKNPHPVKGSKVLTELAGRIDPLAKEMKALAHEYQPQRGFAALRSIVSVA